MKNDKLDSVDLDALFAVERNAPVVPSSDFLAQIMQDAVEVQAQFTPLEAKSAAQFGLWQSLVAAIGGWPTVAGLATATVAGIWIGISPPSGLDTLTESVMGTSFGYSDYLPNLDSVLAEG